MMMGVTGVHPTGPGFRPWLDSQQHRGRSRVNLTHGFA